MLKVYVILCAIVNLINNAEIDNEYELVLVHGIFRHGARTTYGFYPKDPHRNNTFYPIGLGGLTNDGKLQEYKLGQFLRQEYGNFLDEVYSEGLIETRSTGVERTIMSAQLVLAGLFPPVQHQIWHPKLSWQPIPIYFRSEEEEDIIHPKYCAYRQKVESTLSQIPDVYNSYIKPYQKLYDYINQHSGSNITTVHDLLEFYFIVSTEHEMNLTLPEWLKSIYPEPIFSTASLTYHYLNYDDKLRKINMGFLLNKIIKDTQAKMEGKAAHQNRKMYLYSGHETTLGFFLDGLKMLKPHVPPYASIVLIEVRKNKSQQYFVKLKYKKGENENPKIFKIPGCSSLCPWDKFLKITDEVLPKVSIKEACDL